MVYGFALSSRRTCVSLLSGESQRESSAHGNALARGRKLANEMDGVRTTRCYWPWLTSDSYPTRVPIMPVRNGRRLGAKKRASQPLKQIKPDPPEKPAFGEVLSGHHSGWVLLNFTEGVLAMIGVRLQGGGKLRADAPGGHVNWFEKLPVRWRPTSFTFGSPPTWTGLVRSTGHFDSQP